MSLLISLKTELLKTRRSWLFCFCIVAAAMIFVFQRMAGTGIGHAQTRPLETPKEPAGNQNDFTWFYNRGMDLIATD
jgi:hypothetical protein